jgi:hypothetical protein
MCSATGMSILSLKPWTVVDGLVCLSLATVATTLVGLGTCKLGSS